MAPENQSQPSSGSYKNPTGTPEPGEREPKTFGADPDRRTSDLDASHQPNEGSSVRSGDGEPSAAQEFGQGGHGRDRRLDYGSSPGSATANAGDGTGDLTAGSAVADALPPDAVAEEAEIAADDVGASAFAEAAGARANPTTEGSGAMADDPQGDEVDPGAG